MMFQNLEITGSVISCFENTADSSSDVVIMKPCFLLLVFLAVASAILVAGCTQNAAPQEQTPVATNPPSVATGDTIKVASSTLGNILVDQDGKTLYYFALDIPGSGGSMCGDNCIGIWPAFFTKTISVSSPLSSSDFSSLIRADGMSQITYHGWPLYYFQGDSNAGDVNGQNVTGNWFVVKPDYTVMIGQNSSLGTYLVDPAGRTLYYFVKDTPGMSACTGTCTGKWTAFSAGTISAPSVLNPSDFGTVSGSNQTTYKGRPLYYFTGDTMPGQVSGQGFNNLWYVASITGTVPAAPTSTPMPTQTPTTIVASYAGSGGGGGY